MKRLLALALIMAGCRTHFDPPPVAPPPRPIEDPHHLGLLPGFDPLLARSVWFDARRETESFNPALVTQPDVSRDGTKLAYAGKEDGRWHIYTKTLGTNAVTRVSYTTANHLFPRFSPDGNFIAYASDRDGDWNIYVARLDAPMAVLQLTMGAHDEVAPAWSPDGAKVACCAKSLRGAWQLMIVDVKTRIPTLLGPGLYPGWSPKGDWIVFQTQPEHAGGFSAIQVVKPDGTELKTIVDSQKWGAAMPRWSPDGDWICFSTHRKSREGALFGLMDEADDVWVVKPDGSLRTQITDQPAPEYWPTMANSRLYFVSPHEGDLNIWSVKYLNLDPTVNAGAPKNP